MRAPTDSTDSTDSIPLPSAVRTRAARLPPWVAGALVPFLVTRAVLLYVGTFSYRLPFLRRWTAPGAARASAAPT